jgi:hypothetical protein
VRGEIAIVGPDEPKRTIASGYASAGSVRWSTRGDELW